MLRLQWDRIAQIKALKELVADLKFDSAGISDDDLKNRVKEITSKDPGELNRDFKLLVYPDEIIQKIEAKELDISYLDEIEGFIIKLSIHQSAIHASFGEQKIREILVGKAIDGLLEHTRSFRDLKNALEDAAHQKEVEKILTDFLNKKTQSISDVNIQYKAITDAGKKQKKKAVKKKAAPKKQPKRVFTHTPLKPTKKQQTLLEDVRKQFETTSTPFSVQEKSYIAEALSCLENDCYKAATIMIWASGIDRILAFLEKGANLADFNAASSAMATIANAPYKHFVKNFQKNAASVDAIRLSANDRHLLAYVNYKAFITGTQFKKLNKNYEVRCDCAHPTDISISANEVISIFENVQSLILNNAKII